MSASETQRTDGLIEAIRKAINIDEHLARYAGGTGSWTLGASVNTDHGTPQREVTEGPYVHTLVRGDTRAHHVAHHDPKRVLRQVAAARKMLAAFDTLGLTEGLLVEALAEMWCTDAD